MAGWMRQPGDCLSAEHYAYVVGSTNHSRRPKDKGASNDDSAQPDCTYFSWPIPHSASRTRRQIRARIVMPLQSAWIATMFMSTARVPN